MTNLAYELIACPYCLDEVERAVFKEIDLAEDEDLRERILKKQINAYQCTNCGHEFVLARSLIVIDSEHQLVIHYAANLANDLTKELALEVSAAPNSTKAIFQMQAIEQAEQARVDAGETVTQEDVLTDYLQGALAPALDKDAYLKRSQVMQERLDQYNQTKLAQTYLTEYPNWTYRLVLEYNDLIEKLQIADNNLEDTAMELIKLASLKSSSQQEAEQAMQRIFFLQADENHLVFMVYRLQKGWDYYDLPAETYTNTQLYNNYLSTRQDFDLVDQGWAQACFDEILQAAACAEAKGEGEA